MKPIKISAENEMSIQHELDRVNGKASLSVMSSKQVVKNAAEAEVHLIELVGAKRHAAGAIYTARSGQPVSRAYGHPRLATRVRMERRSSGWWLTDVERCEIYTNQGAETTLRLTPAQDIIAVRLLRTRYSILKPGTLLQEASAQEPTLAFLVP